MYEKDDLRSKLSGSDDQKPAAPKPSSSSAAYGMSSYGRWYQEDPVESGVGDKSWFTRGQNFVVCYSQIDGEVVFERKDQVDEYVLLLPAGEVSATISANGETLEAAPYSLTIIPPGDSVITLSGSGEAVRLISSLSADVVAKATNPEKYQGEHPHIPPLENWPDPVGGFKIRNYSLDVPEEEGRFGKIFRCTNFMVNCFPPMEARDITKLSPHHHDDFEQCSLALRGWYVHHLRWPWTANQNDWVEDEHEVCQVPSVCIIPPRVIHTSAPSEPSANVLVDIFSPPREDFSAVAGWVLNADDYPSK